MTAREIVPMWRNFPTIKPQSGGDLPTGRLKIALPNLFPSGRAALTTALSGLGLSRSCRVAVPEWSSACVINSVGRIATPIPMREAVEYQLDVDALVIYEMWGWPLLDVAIARLRERFPHAPVILDRVDTVAPGLRFGEVPVLGVRTVATYSIWSLGKVLGVIGAGLLQDERGEFIEFAADEDHRQPEVDRCDAASVNRYRDAATRPSEDVLELLAAGGIEAALSVEQTARSANLGIVEESQEAQGWRPWMHDAAAAGAAPNLAPILIDATPDVLAKMQLRLRQEHCIETQPYHFNFSGDPIAPEYLRCLAVPLHSGVEPDVLRDALSTRSQRGISVVVGAGIPGMLAARMLSTAGRKVVLVDSAPVVGGLYRSEHDELGNAYDIGTHIPMETRHADCDRLLYAGLQVDQWNVIKRSLREGVIEGGELDHGSGCPSVEHYPEIDPAHALRQVVTAAGTARHWHNLETQLQSTFGEQITDVLFRPVMLKLTGRELSELGVGAHRGFSLTRIRIGDETVTAALKLSPELDNRIAHARTTDGDSDLKKLYPRDGGAQLWVDSIAESLTTRGVEFALGTHVTAMDLQDFEVRAVTLGDGRCFEVDTLVWTAPPALLLRTAGAEFESKPPTFVDLVLVHARVSGGCGHDLEFLCDYDPEHALYRATFYANLSNCETRPHTTRITLEILDVTGEHTRQLERDPHELVSQLLHELKSSGALPSEATLEWFEARRLPRALPLPLLNEELRSSPPGKSLSEMADALATNIVVGGRRDGGHFISGILLDTYARACAPAKVHAS